MDTNKYTTDPPPDSELIRGGRMQEIPADHWCRECAWATNLMDRFLCPFIEGSCVRIAGTMEKPEPMRLEMEIARKRKQAKGSAQPKEGKFAKRYTIGNETHSVAVWAYLRGIAESTIHRRIRAGMSPEEAILTPVKGEKKK
ncbi:MAG: hypothetical protein IJ466_07240 [Clostridia bacterium]|nr:hypothetical protein [Clostridia bacterium]